MKERPILFSGPMVKAILEGRKTQTRRVITPQPMLDKVFGPEMYEPVAYDRHGEMIPGEEIYGVYDDSGEWGVRCPYGQPGDRLWVRETFCTPEANDYVIYRADWSEEDALNSDAMRKRYPDFANEFPNGRWKPSIHMPRKFCRLLLDVKAVQVQRLGDMACADAGKEGFGFGSTAYRRFQKTWDSLNEKRGYGWDTNPWVWVIEFQTVGDQGQ